MNKDKVVCAAMLMDDGTIISGVRHFSPDMRNTMERIYGKGIAIFKMPNGRRIWLKKPYWLRVEEQGFIDIRGHFLTREEAFNRVLETAQCKHLLGVSMPNKGVALFSEDLY